MAGKLNGEKLRAFLNRRKSNTIGLMIITVFSIAVTLMCALTGFRRTDVLIAVCLMLVLLCFVQLFRMRKSFRTIHAFKGIRKRKK